MSTTPEDLAAQGATGDPAPPAADAAAELAKREEENATLRADLRRETARRIGVEKSLSTEQVTYLAGQPRDKQDEIAKLFTPGTPAPAAGGTAPAPAAPAVTVAPPSTTPSDAALQALAGGGGATLPTTPDPAAGSPFQAELAKIKSDSTSPTDYQTRLRALQERVARGELQAT